MKTTVPGFFSQFWDVGFFFQKKVELFEFMLGKKVQNFPFMLNKRQKAVARKKTKKN